MPQPTSPTEQTFQEMVQQYCDFDGMTVDLVTHGELAEVENYDGYLDYSILPIIDEEGHQRAREQVWTSNDVGNLPDAATTQSQSSGAPAYSSAFDELAARVQVLQLE